MKDGDLKPVFKKIIIISGLIILISCLFFISFLAPAFVESIESNNNYLIKISGLNNLTAAGETKIMIPLPVYTDGEPVFSDEYLKRVNDEPETYRMDPGWNLSVERTYYGDMMVLRTSMADLSDIDMILAEFDRMPEPRLLMPALNISAEEFRVEESGLYESLIYLNGTFDSVEVPVDFNLRYTGGGGMKFCIKGDIWKSSLKTSISSANKGFSNTSISYFTAESWD